MALVRIWEKHLSNSDAAGQEHRSDDALSELANFPPDGHRCSTYTFIFYYLCAYYIAVFSAPSHRSGAN